MCAACTASVTKPFGARCWRCNRLSPDSRTCPGCRNAGPLSHVWISTTYAAHAQQLIQRFKFGHQRAAAEPLGRIMADTITLTGSMVIVPVPTATGRVRERGFAHSELLARRIASQLKLEYMPALRRLGQSRQLGASRETRLKQLSDSFVLRSPKSIAGQRVLLVDDVLTTGGTLIAAAKILKAGGAKEVNALVFAKKL